MIPIHITWESMGIKRSVVSAIPTDWDELTPKQLVAIATNYNTETGDPQFFADLLCIDIKTAGSLSEFHKYSITKELLFMTEFTPLDHFIINVYNGLVSPLPRMEGMSFGQFMFVDTYYERAVTKSDPASVDKFIACLYLPLKGVFNEILIPERSVSASLNIPKNTKVAMLMNYRLVKEWICQHYPVVFPKAVEKPEPGIKHSRKSKGRGWVTLFESLVGDDIINQDRYAQLPLHSVLRFLTKKIKENGR